MPHSTPPQYKDKKGLHLGHEGDKIEYMNTNFLLFLKLFYFYFWRIKKQRDKFHTRILLEFSNGINIFYTHLSKDVDRENHCHGKLDLTFCMKQMRN